MKKHKCEKELEKQYKANVRLTPSLAQDGDTWTCACGKTYTHICDEAEGCCWEVLPQIQY